MLSRILERSLVMGGTLRKHSFPLRFHELTVSDLFSLLLPFLPSLRRLTLNLFV